jgi:pSer/pThr/pTyr-binding forkhead associated (FHA) protein
MPQDAYEGDDLRTQPGGPAQVPRWRRAVEPQPGSFDSDANDFRRAPRANPGGLRAKLIRLLGGQVPGETAAPVAAGSRPEPAPPRISYNPPQPEPMPPPEPIPRRTLERHIEETRTEALPPTAPARQPEQEEQDETKTKAFGGIDISRLKIPKYNYAIQILDANGQWREWGPISAQGLNVGRARQTPDFPALMSLAVRHMRLSYEESELQVEDQGSLNGVYLKITRPHPLADGNRFRISNQVFEFHLPGPVEPVEPLKSEDGEEFCSRDIQALAYIDVIGPNNQPALRFPITRADTTLIGRDGKEVALAFPKDGSISGVHAQIRHDDGRFLLEDLKSRNGTFVRLEGPSIVHPGDVLLAGQVLFRIHDPKAL